MAGSQVAQMLHDRPAMAEFEKDAEFLRDWAARKFAGEDFGELIDWDPSPPLHSDAEHLAAGDGEHAAILVEALTRPGPTRTCRDRSRSFGPERSTNCTTSPCHAVCPAQR